MNLLEVINENAVAVNELHPRKSSSRIYIYGNPREKQA